MTDLGEVLRVYKSVAEQLKTRDGVELPELSEARLAVESQAVADSDEASLTERISEYRSGSGWLAHQSGVDWFPRQAPPSGPLGRLLSAEMAEPNGVHSLHVRRNGRDDDGGWIVTKFVEGEGDFECLAQTVIYLAETWRETGNLVYRRYWAPDEETGIMRQRFARFVGFRKV